MAAAMQGWNLTIRLLPSLAQPPPPCWISHAHPTFFPAYAAGGKGFGELMKQRKSKGKEQETPISSLSSSGGDTHKKGGLSSNEDFEARLDADVDSEDGHSVCSCGGGEKRLGYIDCCMPYHKGTAVAPDGLSLLRARFSAYAHGIVGYVASTTHPENPDFGDNLLAAVQATCDQLRFYKLDIMQYEPISDQESTVSFRVVYGRRKEQGDRRVMEEKSYFLREGDTWLFKDGEALNKASGAELSASQANKSDAKLSKIAAAGFGSKSNSRRRKS